MGRSILVLALLAVVGCSSNGSTTIRSATTEPGVTASVSAAPLPHLVGQWALNKTCAAIVNALTQAGLADLISLDVAETLKLPENAPLPASWDPSHPCADAKPPTEHSHTFWADGAFNSFDQNGQQVDDGQYKLVNDHTFIFPGSIPITMHYRIQGDTIMFDPVIPKNCTTKQCRGTLAWAFSVANPGQTWTRVTSGPNVPFGTGSSG